MVAGRLVGGSGSSGPGLDVGVATPTSAPGGRGRRWAGRPVPRTGAGVRCRSTRSARMVMGGECVRSRPPRSGRRGRASQGWSTDTRSASTGPDAGPGRQGPCRSGASGCGPACAGRASPRQSPAREPGQRRRRRRLDLNTAQFGSAGRGPRRSAVLLSDPGLARHRMPPGRQGCAWADAVRRMVSTCGPERTAPRYPRAAISANRRPAPWRYRIGPWRRGRVISQTERRGYRHRDCPAAAPRRQALPGWRHAQRRQQARVITLVHNLRCRNRLTYRAIVEALGRFAARRWADGGGLTGGPRRGRAPRGPSAPGRFVGPAFRRDRRRPRRRCSADLGHRHLDAQSHPHQPRVLGARGGDRARRHTAPWPR